MHSISAMLEASSRTYPDRIALQLGSNRFTYGQLRDNVANVTYHLRHLGITPGDTVALLFQNTPACAIGFLALACLHAHVIPLEPEVTANELESIYEDSPFSAVIGTGAKLSQFGQFIVGHSRSCIDLADLLAKSQKTPSYSTFPQAESSESVFLYHYTSGSTGKPKAALHTQANLIQGGIIYQQTYSIRPEDSILVPIPLFHSFGMIAGLIASLLSAARLVLVERFVPQLIVQTLAGEKITLLLAVPLMYDLMARCSLPGTPDVSALRVCLSSGAPLPPETARSFSERYHQPIYQVYGSTETGVIATQWPDSQQWPLHSIGRPLMGVQVRIVDTNGQDVPTNETGNLLVKTSTMFTGYLNSPDATARVFQDGWYVTGDVARQDDQGYLYLIGRKDTFINVGGRKVNPLQVEEVLLAHPMVREAVVFGRDAGSAGEQIQATVVLKGKVSEEELMTFCRKQLPTYKVPSSIEFLAELPKTSLGKVRRVL